MNPQRVFATDGSIRQSKGSFWSCIEITDSNLILSCGKCTKVKGYKHTSNRGELVAIAECFKRYNPGDGVLHIYTDSMYCINSIGGWMHNWKANGWKTKEGNDVKNKDIFTQLIRITKWIPFELHHIKGHIGIDINELADKLAQLAADCGLVLDEKVINTQEDLDSLIRLCQPRSRITISIERIFEWILI